MHEQPTATPDTPARRTLSPRQREVLSWALHFFMAFVLAMVIRTFLFEPVRVQGESMRETLQNRELMIASKWDYVWGDPSRFDVVICSFPNRTETFVKRVVGLPGESVALRGGELYIDGELVEQHFRRTSSQRDFGPVLVPEDSYFVMGDNRDHSNDSRAAAVGPLPRSMIRGHVQLIAFPLGSVRRVRGNEP